MTALSRDAIEKSAEAGDAEAQIELSQRLEREGHHDLSLEWLKRAAESELVGAKTLLAKRFLTQPPFVVDEALQLLSAAAGEGDGEAAHVLAVMTAGGLGVECNWSAALDLAQRSAELGFELARKELAFLAGAGDTNKNAPASLWKELRDAVDIEALIVAPRPKWALRNPRIFVVEKFASAEICDWLIARARPNLVAAQDHDAQTDFHLSGQTRNNSLANFGLFKLDLVFFILWARISTVTEIPSGAEPPNIFHYAVGESYDPHFDFITSSPGVAQAMQRVVTFLLYLNDDYEAGGTEFPTANWGYKGNKGDAMFFWNVDANGAPDQSTVHAGTAPTKGEKWIFSQWIQGQLAQA